MLQPSPTAELTRQMTAKSVRQTIIDQIVLQIRIHSQDEESPRKSKATSETLGVFSDMHHYIGIAIYQFTHTTSQVSFLVFNLDWKVCWLGITPPSLSSIFLFINMSFKLTQFKKLHIYSSICMITIFAQKLCAPFCKNSWTEDPTHPMNEGAVICFQVLFIICSCTP